MTSFFTRPFTHALLWSCNLLNMTIPEYRIEARCKACNYAWSMMLIEFMVEKINIERELEIISRELEEAHKKFKKPDVHLLKPHSAIPIYRRQRISYACGKDALFFSEFDPVLWGLGIYEDDWGEGFTVDMQKLTCEHCVAAFFDPILKLHQEKNKR